MLEQAQNFDLSQCPPYHSSRRALQHYFFDGDHFMGRLASVTAPLVATVIHHHYLLLFLLFLLLFVYRSAIVHYIGERV